MTTIENPSQIDFVNVLATREKPTGAKKVLDKFCTDIKYKADPIDMSDPQLRLILGDAILKELDVRIGERLTPVRIPAQPYRVGFMKYDDGMAVSTRRSTNGAKERLKVKGTFEDGKFQMKYNKADKLPSTDGDWVKPDDWDFITKDDKTVLVIDLPHGHTYIDHIIETE